jgi:hypothetical protein
MRIFVLALCVLAFSTSAFAVPSDLKLIRPKKLDRVQGKKLKITFELPCSNDEATDWSRVVMTNDDSGDMLGVVAMVVPMDGCKKGPPQDFTMVVNPEDHGYALGRGPVSNYFKPASLARGSE